MIGPFQTRLPDAWDRVRVEDLVGGHDGGALTVSASPTRRDSWVLASCIPTRIMTAPYHALS
jgi:hypothetical protein